MHYFKFGDRVQVINETFLEGQEGIVVDYDEARDLYGVQFVLGKEFYLKESELIELTFEEYA